MNIFIAFTPYHVLLTILAKKRKSNDFIILIDESGNLKKYKTIIEYFTNNTYYLNNFYSSKIKKYFDLNWLFKTNLKNELIKLTGRLNLCGSNNIFIYNDNSPVGQFLLENLRGSVSYIEDGSAPYNDHDIKNSIIKKVIYKLFYGSFYEFSNVLGTTSRIEKSIFTFPELVRIENRKKPFEKYELVSDYLLILQKISIYLGGPKNDLSDLVEKNIILILLPRKINETSFELAYYIKLIRYEVECGNTVLLKKHPLDAMDKLPVNVDSNIKFISSHISSEILIANLNGLKKVYGPPSTSLMSAKYFFPNLEIFLINNSNSSVEDRFSKSLEKIGIRPALLTKNDYE